MAVRITNAITVATQFLQRGSNARNLWNWAFRQHPALVSADDVATHRT
jgi:hypothetical protein